MTGVPDLTTRLLHDLCHEMRARDPGYVDRFPIEVPGPATIRSWLGRQSMEPDGLDRMAAAIEDGFETLRAQGLRIVRGAGDPAGLVVAEGVAEAVAAGLGRNALCPEPAVPTGAALDRLLATRFDGIRLASGREALVARRPGRPLLVISALGVPIDIWGALLADEDGPFRPVFIEGRCGGLREGGVQSDAGLETHAAELAAALAELDLGVVDVLGWCNGGRIAIDLARRAPAAIRALLLLSPTLRGAAAHPSPYEDNLATMFARVRARPASAIPLARILLQLTAPPAWEQVLDPHARARLFLSRPAANRAEALNRPTATGPHLLNQALRTEADEAYPVVEALAALTMPLMVVLGAEDAVVSNAQTTDVLRQAGVQRGVVVRGAGHGGGDLQYRYLRQVAGTFFADPRAECSHAGPGRLRALDMLGAPEWADHGEGWPRDGVRVPLARLYGNAAALGPDRPALSDGQVGLNFGALESGARRLAGRLIEAGVTPGGHVLVLSEKRIVVPLVAGAIWKAGCVYVPVDAENPAARLALILDQIRPMAIIGPAAALAGLRTDAVTISFEAVMDDATAGPAPDVGGAVDEDAAAYVLFTSGSTGVPKGVVISHRSLLDYFYNHNQVLRIGPDSRVFSLAPFHFDVSIEDTILPLSLGAFVFQFRGMALGPLLRRALRRERITHLIAVSSLLALITGDGAEVTPAHMPDLGMVMTGAEVCEPGLIDSWVTRMPHTRVINAYGPTEATIVCLTHTIGAPEPGRIAPYPIGVPLPGVTILLLDEDGAPIDTPDAVGELAVGGTQVMTGYLGRPDDTARACIMVDGHRYYRTGDFCSRDASSLVTFIGRRDDMRKIGGRRIDLGEIRNDAQALDGVIRAAVGTIPINGRDAIGLVLVAAGSAPLDLASVRTALSGTLLPYMVPAVIGAVSDAWLTSTGKTDERSLLRQLAASIERRGAVDGVLLPPPPRAPDSPSQRTPP